MTRTPTTAGAAALTTTSLAMMSLAAAFLPASAQEAGPESYLRFFGSVHEPVSKRTSGNVPTAFTPEGIATITAGTDDLDVLADAGAFADAGSALDAALGSRRQETSMGYGGGAVIGVRFAPRIGAELEVAHRTHDVTGATSEEVYDANEAAFTSAARRLRGDDRADAPEVAVPEDAERTIAVTTYMVNSSYFFPALGRVAPYASAGVGWASPAGDVSDYDGNVAYQARLGADVDLGPVLVGVQGTYVGAGDFERALEAPDLGGPQDVAPDRFGAPGKASVEYGVAEVAVTLTVPLSRR